MVNIIVNLTVMVIVFYRDAADRSPFEEFLDRLPAKDAQKVTWTLRLIEEFDVIPGTYFKKLVNTDGIWEVRARVGSNAYRILCFFHKSSIVVLTNGFRKKTQKTPPGEIRLAETRKNEWLRRNQ